MPTIFHHLPAGASAMQIMHFGQWITTGRFGRFVYRQDDSSPPAYNLSRVTVPIAVYYAQGDYLTVVADVKKLIAELPNVINDYLVPHANFNHLDFVWAINAPRLVYDKVVQILKSRDLE